MPIIPDSRITKIVNSKYQRDTFIEMSIDAPINIENVENISTKDEDYSSVLKAIPQSKNNIINISNNVNLIKNLENYGLLLSDNHICDCNMFLGESIFDIFQQTLNIQNKTFNFYAVEKNKELVDLFNQNLLKFWPKIQVTEGDIIEQNLSKYNIIFTNTPSKDIEELKNIYLKIVDDLPTYGILIENLDKGLGFRNCLIDLLETHPQIEIIDVDGFVIYQKV